MVPLVTLEVALLELPELVSEPQPLSDPPASIAVATIIDLQTKSTLDMCTPCVHKKPLVSRKEDGLTEGPGKRRMHVRSKVGR
jgi:hypothetical protein